MKFEDFDLYIKTCLCAYILGVLSELMWVLRNIILCECQGFTSRKCSQPQSGMESRSTKSDMLTMESKVQVVRVLDTYVSFWGRYFLSIRKHISYKKYSYEIVIK